MYSLGPTHPLIIILYNTPLVPTYHFPFFFPLLLNSTIATTLLALRVDSSQNIKRRVPQTNKQVSIYVLFDFLKYFIVTKRRDKKSNTINV